MSARVAFPWRLHGRILARHPWHRCHLGALRWSSCARETSKREEEEPPGVRAAWRAATRPERRQIVVLSVSSAVLNLGFGVMIPALPALSRELGFGASGVGLLLAAPGMARVLWNLPAGVVVDRAGHVPCMVTGEVAAAAGCMATALGTSLEAMLVMRFVQGLGSSLASAGASAYLTALTERQHLKAHRGSIIGAQGGLVSVAYVVGPAVGGLLSELYGVRTACALVAGLVAACGAAYGTLPRLSVPAASLSTRQPAGVAGTLREAMATWATLLQDRNQQALLAANLALFVNYAATVAVLPLQAFHVFGLSTGGIGALYSVASLLGILVSPLAGALSDRVGRTTLVTPSILVCALGCFGVAFSPTWEGFVAFYLLWSLGEAVLSPVLIAYASDIAPKQDTALALSLSKQAGDFALFLGPPLLGLLYDALPGGAAMSATALLTLAGGAAFRRLATEAVAKRP